MSQDGKLVASVSADGTLKLWNSETGEIEADHYISDYPVNDCAVFLNDSLVALTLRIGTLQIRSLPGGDLAREITVVTNNDGLNKCALIANNAWLAAAGGDGTLTVCDPLQGHKITSIRTSSPLTNCTWCASDCLLVAVGVRGVFFFELVLPPDPSRL
jgi:WD40 repeat protein